MSQLAPEEHDIVQQHPLQETLDTVRDILREASCFSEGDTENHEHLRPKTFAAVMSKIFHLLSGTEVPLLLASRTGRESLLFDVSLVRSRLQQGSLGFDIFVPLSRLITQCAADVDIWKAVIAIIRGITHSTPPPSVLPAQDTPIRHSSASQQGSGQTRRDIDYQVFQEIRDCTFREVGGFHEKFFQGKRWERRARRAWKTLKAKYDENEKRWDNLSDFPLEDECCAWWMGLSHLLSQERLAYFRSSSSNLVGEREINRQLDILVKKRSTAKEDRKHKWENVLVVGELKRSEKASGALWLQLGSAVHQVFVKQPTRMQVHAFSLTGTKMENWVFDRSGAYSGHVFDVNDEPEKFIQIFCGYLMMSDEELGVNTSITKKKGMLIVEVPESARQGRKRKLELDAEPIAFQQAIVCRGTTCFSSRTRRAGFDGVVKFSWTSDLRPPEADLLQKADERGVKGLAKLYGYDEITSVEVLRHSLDFAASHKFRHIQQTANVSTSQSPPPSSHSFSQFHSLTTTSSRSRKRKPSDPEHYPRKSVRSNSSALGAGVHEATATYAMQDPEGTNMVPAEPRLYANRILRVIAISPKGRSINQFKSISELLKSLRDAIIVHRSLFIDGQILHRDISENNIIIADSADGDGFKGMLIDLDLAKEVGKGTSGAQHRTGTIEFMAIEVLLRISHTYRHDLEAFFYVLVWLCARRGWALCKPTEQPPKRNMLSRWYSGDYESIAQVKRGDMDKNGLEIILREFPPNLERIKPLCRTVRDVLFPYKDGLFIGTPQDPSVLYDPIINAFSNTIVTFGAEKITS